jgi:crossover junction endodeoxyribonuclease RusA
MRYPATGNIAKALGGADTTYGMKRSGTIVLPYPPTINHYYGRGHRGNVYIKPEGKAYRTQVNAIIGRRDPIVGPVAIRFWMYPPDRRARDIDNIRKALFDALQSAGVYINDSQIVLDSGRKMAFDGEGRIEVEVERDTLTAA